VKLIFTTQRQNTIEVRTSSYTVITKQDTHRTPDAMFKKISLDKLIKFTPQIENIVYCY